MALHGKNFIAGEISASGGKTYQGIEAATGKPLDGIFIQSTETEINLAAEKAAQAFDAYRLHSPAERAAFLREIGAQIEAVGDALIDRANSETALGVDRLRGERGRTIGQLKMFADLIEEGSWVGARIDHAIPDRKPVPKPDLRRMLIPLGPVAVFGASNFPLAFSVAGGDTASALAAGCPVVVKAHPAHPGTSEIVAAAVTRAIEVTKMPAGVFSMVHGVDPAASLALVRHSAITAVGFTGSLKAGRALFDAAAARPAPIPVYAEMGSVNPIFLLPGALAERGEQIAQGLRQSVTMGCGQFCTKPGVVVGLKSGATDQFVKSVAGLMQEVKPATMLHGGIRSAYLAGTKEMSVLPDVRAFAATNAGTATTVAPVLFVVEGDAFLKQHRLGEELFGPASVLVTVSSRQQMLEIAHGLEGALTATIHGTPDDLRQADDLIHILQKKTGRLIFNGFPTGVEVCPSMQHGGPYPATTDSRSTSVGTAAIERFVRPIAYQNFPPDALPPELRDENPRRIFRIMDGKWTAP
jgi:NADP-dependent aldehyde dehydrogenase